MDDTHAVPPPTSALDGRYRCERLLSHRDGVDTFRAHDMLLDRVVTVVLHRGGGAAGPAPEGWLRETAALRDLAHEHVASLQNGGFTDDGAYLVLPVAGARTPGAEIARRRPPTDRVALWCHDLARGLRHAHLRGVTHGSVDVDSVLVDDDGEAQWFAFAHAAVDTSTGPEAQRRRAADLRGLADLAVSLLGPGVDAAVGNELRDAVCGVARRAGPSDPADGWDLFQVVHRARRPVDRSTGRPVAELPPGGGAHSKHGSAAGQHVQGSCTRRAISRRAAVRRRQRLRTRHRRHHRHLGLVTGRGGRSARSRSR